MVKEENGIEDVAESLEDLLDFSVSDTKEKKRGAVVRAAPVVPAKHASLARRSVQRHRARIL